MRKRTRNRIGCDSMSDDLKALAKNRKAGLDALRAEGKELAKGRKSIEERFDWDDGMFEVTSSGQKDEEKKG